MSDLTPKDPRAEPGAQKPVELKTNPTKDIEVWFENGKFGYSNGTGNVTITRKANNTNKKFMIRLNRRDKEKWDFVDGEFRWKGVDGAPEKTKGDNTKDVLKASYKKDRVTIRDIVDWDGTNKYKYTFEIKLHEGGKVEKTPDPEITNNKEISTATDH